MVESAEGLSDLVDSANSHTPKWEHIVNENIYSKELAKKHIIGHKQTDALQEDVAALYRAIYDLSSTMQRWACGSLLGADDRWGVAMEKLRGAHNGGKQFLKVRAGCAIVQMTNGSGGSAQSDDALALVAKGGLPAKLTRELNGIVVSWRTGSQRFEGGAKRKVGDAIDVVPPKAGEKDGVVVEALPVGVRMRGGKRPRR